MLPIFQIKHSKFKKYNYIARIFFIVFAAILVLKLMSLQVFDFKNLKDEAKKMRQSKAFMFRGEIVDRKGVRLAADKTLYDIYAHPKYYKRPKEDIALILSKHLGMSQNELINLLSKNYSTIKIAKNVEREVVEALKKKKLRSLSYERLNKRIYPQGKLASHILGYVNPKANMKAGVEQIAAENLMERPKYNPVEVDGRGNVLYDFGTDPEDVVKPLEGKKLYLTIDAAIQHVAESELAKMVEKTDAERGTVIVMNPKNGEILAFAVLPSYDPAKYNKFDFSTIKNWVLSDVYPPGSTFKILTIASGLETDAITKDEQIEDTGKMKVQGWTIQNYDYYDHKYPGMIDLKYLFEHSSNVGSLKVALKMDKQDFYDQLVKFGIGQKTGIDLPGESSGILPKVKTWDESRQATIGFGYSIASTPIQIASAVAAIANDGQWVTPHVIKYDKKTARKKIKKVQVMSKENARILTEILADSIQNSKSPAGKIPNFSVAGKTGTSRKPNPSGPGYLVGQVFTSFVGYFPSNDPQALIMIVVDNPKGAGVWGSTVAGPVFNKIATQVTRLLKLKPDKK